MPPQEELMIKDIRDPAAMKFSVQANNSEIFVLPTATIRIRNQRSSTCAVGLKEMLETRGNL